MGRYDSNILLQRRPSALFKAAVAGGLSIPIAAHHYQQMAG